MKENKTCRVNRKKLAATLRKQAELESKALHDAMKDFNPNEPHQFSICFPGSEKAVKAK